MFHYDAALSLCDWMRGLSLLIQRGSCLWQKQWQVTGATKINRPLPSTANQCEHLPYHIATRGSVDAFAHCKISPCAQMKNKLPFTSGGDCWPSLKLAACAKVRHPQLLFVHKQPKGILDSVVYSGMWFLSAFIFDFFMSFWYSVISLSFSSSKEIQRRGKRIL